MKVKRGNLTRFSLLIIGFLVLILSVVYSVNEPTGPDTITVTNSSRGSGDVAAPVTIQAIAGNVTELKVSDERNTQAWQGYYGNISGTISLEDGIGNTFYDWTVTNPRGEIYASNFTTVTWASIYCINVSQNGTGVAGGVLARPDGSISGINGSQIELNFGINETDLDGLNETFPAYYTNTVGFFVGNIHISDIDGCSSAHPYVNSAASAAWDEVILSDNDTIVFTAIIREDATNYKNMASDFQLMVLENEHVGKENTPTNYYFYVEIS